MTKNLHQFAYDCLIESDAAQKCRMAKALFEGVSEGKLSAGTIDLPELKEAGRPERPELVHPREVPKRKLGTVQGRAAAIHSFCHIEFNAINLACDAVYRFQGLPESFYRDWSRIAAEEAYHFGLLSKRLETLGFSYGDFPAHNGLWELAQKTSADLLDRMALIPRVMEARGLDVTPAIQKKFKNVDDMETVGILDIILRDEITHVKAGTLWFHFVCDQRGLEPESTYLNLVKTYMKGDVQCPMHFQARLEAGFSASELEMLQVMCQKR